MSTLKVPTKPTIVPDRTGTRTIARISVVYTAVVAATTRFVLEREVTGRRGPHGCRLPSARDERAAHCMLLVHVASFTHQDEIGLNRISLTSVVPARLLPPGTYVLQSVLADTGGAPHTFSAVFAVESNGR